MWKAKAQNSDTGWPVLATTIEASARVSGAQAAMAMPMVILPISSGSRRTLAYQRQNSTDRIISTVEIPASSDSIQVIGMVLPKKTIWKFFRSEEHTSE